MQSFFPAFVNLTDKKILVVGGGKIAGDKISHLLNFTKQITIISPEISKRVEDQIKQNSLVFLDKKYNKGDIDGFYVVIVATDDEELQKNIFFECQNKKIFCNSVKVKCIVKY